MRINEIKTDRFKLRKYRISDAPVLPGHLNERAINRWMISMPYPYTLKDAKDWISKPIGEYRKQKPGMIVYVIEIDGKLAGAIGIHDVKYGHQAEVGYWLAKEHWGRGIMSEALKEMEKFCFRELKLKRLYAMVISGNRGSERVLERNGFVLEGKMRKNLKNKNRYYDSTLWAKVK